MKKLFYILIILVFFACSKEKDAREKQWETIDKLVEKDTLFEEINGIYIKKTKQKDTLEYYKEGDTIFLSVSGKTLNSGVVFAQDDLWKIEYGNYSNLIEGWQIALPLITKNESGIIIIPFKLGYGKRKNGVIPAFSTLQFTYVAK